MTDSQSHTEVLRGVSLSVSMATWVGVNLSMTSLEKPDHDKSQILH